MGVTLSNEDEEGDGEGPKKITPAESDDLKTSGNKPKGRTEKGGRFGDTLENIGSTDTTIS